MGYLREIHFTIARMIEATKRKDEKEVKRLNKNYSRLALNYHKPRLEIEGSYDRCANDCSLAFGMLPNKLEELISDAEKIFSKIPEPREED